MTKNTLLLLIFMLGSVVYTTNSQNIGPKENIKQCPDSVNTLIIPSDIFSSLSCCTELAIELKETERNTVDRGITDFYNSKQPIMKILRNPY